MFERFDTFCLIVNKNVDYLKFAFYSVDFVNEIENYLKGLDISCLFKFQQAITLFIKISCKLNLKNIII